MGAIFIPYVRGEIVRIVVGLVVVAGFLYLMSDNRGSSSDAEPTQTTVVDLSRGLSGTSSASPNESHQPDGFARDEEGAAAAAVVYSTAPQRWLYLSDDEITTAVRNISTPAAADRIAAEVVADVSIARGELARSEGRVWWLVRPLAWRVDRFDADRATVSVWVVTILSAEDVAAPQTEWVTVQTDLTWLDGMWRVDAVRDISGPTPVLGPRDDPWDAARFDNALEGFTRVDGEPVL